MNDQKNTLWSPPLDSSGGLHREISGIDLENAIAYSGMSHLEIISTLQVEKEELESWLQNQSSIPFETWKSLLSEIGPERINFNGRAESGWPEEIWGKCLFAE